jgi:hypothetical protein
MLIDLIGLPKDGDERLFNRLYKACSNRSIFKKGATVELLEGYDSKYTALSLLIRLYGLTLQAGQMSKSMPCAASIRLALWGCR